MVGKGNFCHNREKKATTSAENNINNGDNDALALAVYNAVKVQVPLPPIFLPAVIPYVGARPATTESTLPVATIVVCHTSNLPIFHDGQDSSIVQPINDHTLLPEMIIAHNTDSSDDDECIASDGDDSHESSFEDGYSTSEYDEVEYPHSANLLSYLLKGAQRFDIYDVYREDNDTLAVILTGMK